MALRDALRVPPASQPVQHWHVSPVIDTAAYAFSWLWVLVPLTLLGDERLDYVVVYLIILALTDVHRHFNFPLVLLDRQVRRTHPARFVLFPTVMLALFFASPWLIVNHVYFCAADIGAMVAYTVVMLQVCRRDGSSIALPWTRYALAIGVPAAVAGLAWPSARGVDLDPGWWWLAAAMCSASAIELDTRRRQTSPTPSKRRWFAPGLILAIMCGVLIADPYIDSATRHAGIPTRTLFNTVAIFAGSWNIWHIYMQKYGILRMYAAKSGRVEKLPGWLDRVLVFCWLPLYFAWLGPTYRELVFKYFRRGNHILPDVVAFFDRIQFVAVPVAVAIIVIGLVLWLRREYQATGWRNRPRLVMALGTTLMASAFVLVDPVKAYLAYAFSHAVEYMVFVWAYQRKRYQHRLDHNPPLGRVLARPALAYLTFVLGLAAVFLYFKYFGRYIMPSATQPRAFGLRTASIVLYWSIYQSMVHFYWDGFMWKMRMSSLRAHL
ncbi:MAG: hypothetical protein B7733_15610 [Myxococcales bacterium FL481]|nr:MAG: hypothetical protein B7733_15610 [Myxococcales bacterium FL481]